MSRVLDFVFLSLLCLWVSNPAEADMDPHVRQEISQRLQTLRNKVKMQQDLIHSLQNLNAQQTQKLTTLRMELRSAKSGLKKPTEETHNLEKKQERSTKSARDAATHKTAPKTPTYRFPHQRIAFFALQYSDQTISSQSIVHFDHELLNFRDSYDVMQGVFISPLSGVYIFSVSLTCSKDSTCEAAIVKNGIKLGTVEADSRGSSVVLDQGSITVVTTMDEGDKVWVQGLRSNQVIAGNRDTVFSGALIWELP